MRILDIDLDFFVHGAEHFRSSQDDRLDAEDYPPWSLDETTDFLTRACGLTRRLPGFVVEHHSELFACWRDAIERAALTPPFDVVHVDAHADIGLGDSGYVYLMTELLFQTVDARQYPPTREGALDDGNWLLFAIAARWLSRLTYVLNTKTGPPGDLLTYVMEGYDRDADHIELVAMHRSELEKFYRGPHGPAPVPARREPRVPFRWVPWPDYRAEAPFDVVCLTRSPGFTPQESDELFDAIRARFINERDLALTDSDRPT